MRDARDVRHDPGAQRHIDLVIAARAAGQHGAMARWQLLAEGIGRGAIAHRIECGRLHCVHRGVYAVGHRALSERGRWMAAVLAAGPGAHLSHHHAGALWKMRDTRRALAHVTAPTRRRGRAGIVVHHAALLPDEVTTHHGIPVTGVSRTLLDLAAVLPPHQLERAINEAQYLQLTDPLSLDALLLRYPHRAGTPNLRRILGAGQIGHTRTRSDFEAAFAVFVDAYAIERPDFDVPMVLPSGRRIVADAVWWRQRVIVELDMTATHGSVRSFHADRARDRELQALGWRPVRITDVHFAEDQAGLAADLGTLLTAGRGPTSRSAPPPAAR